ncbi:hypothetical protein [Cylindrospermum sp. FACHB-282]|uniref:hypothetical protein n=1 Tax=Cylindrospermum sp. FACHB-282 TaxID=2692794 RepID=UPI001687BE5D|nr:hypothetical protein [Cylindrospermum sp. FACHB-282]MBD2385196.1 hypothetical protein [Cylindrospermum sp. FACHB-282]
MVRVERFKTEAKVLKNAYAASVIHKKSSAYVHHEHFSLKKDFIIIIFFNPDLLSYGVKKYPKNYGIISY